MFAQDKRRPGSVCQLYTACIRAAFVCIMHVCASARQMALQGHSLSPGVCDRNRKAGTFNLSNTGCVCTQFTQHLGLEKSCSAKLRRKRSNLTDFRLKGNENGFNEVILWAFVGATPLATT